jgi:glycosyltransferase involved in cell wall biosynthesis
LAPPRVSVLLPVRDAAATLGECLDSLAAQSLAEHEVVAVDDGSRDASGEMLVARAAADPRVRVLRPPAGGLAPALNRALGEARAPVVARMDADDVAHPERLLRQLRGLEADDRLDVLACRVERRAEPGVPAAGGMSDYVEWLNGLLDHEAMARERFVESPVAHPSVALRRETLRALGGWRDFEGPEDYELWLRAFDAGRRFAKLPDVLLTWRDRPDRLTRTDPRYSPARFLEVKLAALVRGPLAGQRPVVLWGAGPVAKAWARALLAAGHPLTAFVEVDPRRIGRRLYGVPILGVGAGAALKGPLHLAAVGQKGARRRIRAEAGRRGLVEGADLVAVA